ncbi:hypothetical protein MRX96_024197 [Rhipicephalus microplus]
MTVTAEFLNALPLRTSTEASVVVPDTTRNAGLQVEEQPDTVLNMGGFYPRTSIALDNLFALAIKNMKIDSLMQKIPTVTSSGSSLWQQWPRGASTGAYPTPQQVREILLVLRPPEPAEETVNEDQTTSLTPDLEFRQASNEERPPTPSDERACLQLWVLWAALTLPLFFSMWLFLVPFVISSSSTTRWPDRPTVTTPEPCLKPVQIREPSMPIRANLNGLSSFTAPVIFTEWLYCWPISMRTFIHFL